MNRGWMCGCVLCLALVWLTAGCGSSSMSVGSITPVLGLQPRAAAEGTKIEIGEFKDLRKNMDSNQIGEAKTGFFNASTRMISEEPVSLIVANAVKDGFEKVGFTVVGSGEGDYVVSGKVEKFEATEHATGLSLEYAKGYVRYDLLVQDGSGKTVWGTTLDKYEISETCWDATANDLAVLTLALQHCVESVFADDSLWQVISK